MTLRYPAPSGNADGLGETRKKELVKSGMLLGLRREDDVFVVDSPYVNPHNPTILRLRSLTRSPDPATFKIL
jgi:hypothetical protein